MRLRLKEWLQRRGVTQYQLAKALGVTAPSVGAWVLGHRRRGDKTVKAFPDFQSFEALCNFLQVTPNDLLEFEANTLPSGKTWLDFKELAAA